MSEFEIKKPAIIEAKVYTVYTIPKFTIWCSSWE